MSRTEKNEEYAMSVQVHDGIGPIEESLSQEVSDSQTHQVQNLGPTPLIITQINIKQSNNATTPGTIVGQPMNSQNPVLASSSSLDG